MLRKPHLSLSKEPIMTLGRGALRADRLVYILTVNKPVKYQRGRSRIVYIGTTKRGYEGWPRALPIMQKDYFGARD